MARAVREARLDPLLGPRVYLRDTRRVALTSEDGAVVGFATPRPTKSGWRAGPVYVLPEHRGRGALARFYTAHSGRTWVAFVPDRCTASQKAHERAGFVFWKRGRGGVWLRRGASCAT